MTTRTYLHLSKTETQTLDTAITSLGYTYRSEFFTACAEHLLYGTLAAVGTPDLPGHTADWLHAQTQILEDASSLRQTTLQVLHDLAHAVIAVKGPALTLRLLETDIKTKSTVTPFPSPHLVCLEPLSSFQACRLRCRTRCCRF